MKKKGGKGGKKSDKKTALAMVKDEVPKKIDFTQYFADVHNPIFVKVKHKKDVFMIYTEEYKKSIEIKNELSKIKEIPSENIKLYFNNKRIIEDDISNHDQQIKHCALLYACYKNPDTNEWETINEIINFKAE